jgi:hypothetical protein
MQGAFVVRMDSTRAASEEFVGQVEEVDTGRAIRFRTPTELIQFLRQLPREDRGGPGSSFDQRENDQISR